MTPGTAGSISSSGSGEVTRSRKPNRGGCPGPDATKASIVHTRRGTSLSGSSLRIAHVSRVSSLIRTARQFRPPARCSNSSYFHAAAFSLPPVLFSAQIRISLFAFDAPATGSFPPTEAATRRISRSLVSLIARVARGGNASCGVRIVMSRLPPHRMAGIRLQQGIRLGCKDEVALGEFDTTFSKWVLLDDVPVSSPLWP